VAVGEGTVPVVGLRELQRDFKRMSRELSRRIDRTLKEAADVVRDEAQQRAAGKSPPFNPATVSGYRSRVRGFGRSYVEQSRGKTTGKRADWGVIQMKKVLLPALYAKGDEIEGKIDEMLDRLGNDYGFPEYSPLNYMRGI